MNRRAIKNHLHQPIFRLSPDDTDGTSFVYASSILPTSRLINTKCETCGRGSEVPEGAFNVVVEGGRQFPDLLYCGAYPFLIVSARVVEDWERSTIKDFLRFPVLVKDVFDTKVDLSDAREYFRIELNGSCQVDLKHSGLTFRNQCNFCGRGRIDQVAEKSYALKSHSLKGCGLFRDSILPTIIFCSSTVSDLATKNRHLNMRLREVRLI